jgi:hypothetical protein
MGMGGHQARALALESVDGADDGHATVLGSDVLLPRTAQVLLASHVVDEQPARLTSSQARCSQPSLIPCVPYPEN